MTKQTKNSKQTKNTSQNPMKYVLIGVIILIACYFIYTLLFKEEEKLKPLAVDPQERIKNIKEPEFKKEGELEFLKKDGKTIIRKIDVELAENDDERMQGMMYRKSMNDDKGMLFIFQREEPQSFWMKNTIIPLDIMYVNSKKEIIKMYKNTTPFSEKSLPSVKPATYVVEVSGGFTDRYGINEGDIISFEKQ